VTSHGRQHWFGVPRNDAKRYRYVPKAGHLFAGLYRYRGYYDKVCGKERLYQSLCPKVHCSSSGGGALMMTFTARLARGSASGPLLVYYSDDSQEIAEITGDPLLYAICWENSCSISRSTPKSFSPL